jgi:type I restriction enzyme S subunit
MTGQQLKNSILQMAVQGKLVPQDPNDEPASVLLERIRAEKEKLIKEGKIKKEKNPSVIFRGADNLPYEKIGKNDPVCIAGEVPFEIPESWEWVRLGSIGDWGSGATPSRTTPEYYNGNIPWLKTGDLNDGYITHIPETITERALLETSVRLNPIGSVLIAMYGATIGKLGILQTPATTNQACCACIPFTGIYNEFLFYFLMSQKLAFIKRGEGGAQPNISKEKIVATLMPLPPKAEQKRIVEKLHILQPYIESYTLLEKEDIKLHHSFPEILKKSILQYAIQGKLVSQDPTDEPASALLERIRAEKEQLIKSGKIKRDKHESVIFRRDNSYYERVDGIERCIDDEIPFEISDSWEWCRLGELIETIDTGKSFKCEERPPDKNEYGIIKVSAVTWGTFNQEESKTCFSTSPWVKGYSIQVDDFLICRANTAALVGGCVIVDKISKRLMLSDKVLRIEFSDSISKTYVLYTLRTPFVRAQLSAAASGTSESMKNISQNAIKGLLIPFPPIKEQYRIVSKVEESLSKIKTL